MSVNDIFKVGQSAPKSGKFHCMQCTNSGIVNDLILSKGDIIPPCDFCKEDGRPNGSRVKLIQIYK